MNLSGLFKLNMADLSKGLSIVVLGVVLGAIQEALGAHGFDFVSYNWAGIFDLAVKAAGLYLSKNLLSDSSGKVLGRIG